MKQVRHGSEPFGVRAGSPVCQAQPDACSFGGRGCAGAHLAAPALEQTPAVSEADGDQDQTVAERLNQLGFIVTLNPREDAAWTPGGPPRKPGAQSC